MKVGLELLINISLVIVYTILTEEAMARRVIYELPSYVNKEGITSFLDNKDSVPKDINIIDKEGRYGIWRVKCEHHSFDDTFEGAPHLIIRFAR